MAHPFGDNLQLRSRILEYLRDQALPRIARLTTPLFAPDEQRNHQLVASGIVLRVGPALLLLTASHTVRDWADLLINVGNELHTIRGERWALHSEGEDFGTSRDKLDVSVVRLDESIVERIDSEDVAELEDVDFAIPDIGRDPFLLVGYPEKANRYGLSGDEFNAQTYSLLMHDADAALYVSVAADSDNHIVLPFQKNDTWTVDKRVTAPDLRGISGGGLWRVPTNERPVGKTLLSAIGVEQHAKGRHPHVLGTRMRIILSVAHRAWPDLRKPLQCAVERAVA